MIEEKRLPTYRQTVLNLFYGGLLSVFLLLLLLQHRYVGMYFDDYGYASLTYGWTGNTHGMEYTWGDVFSFLKWHYFNWGGRILYYFFEIAISHIGGVTLMQSIQAVLIFLILLLSGALALKNSAVKGNGLCQILGIALPYILYGTITLTTAADGVYWYMASVSYVWPLFPLFLGNYLLSMEPTVYPRHYNMVIAVLFFLAGFSQEQMAVLAIICAVSNCILYHLEAKRTQKGKFITPYFALVGALVGGGIEILAPGNFARAEIDLYAEFSSLNIFEKISQQLPVIININIGSYNRFFCIFLAISLGCMGAKLLHTKYNKILISVFALFAVYFLSEPYVPQDIQSLLGYPLRLIFAILLIGVTLARCYTHKNYVLLSLFVGGGRVTGDDGRFSKHIISMPHDV